MRLGEIDQKASFLEGVDDNLDCLEAFLVRLGPDQPIVYIHQDCNPLHSQLPQNGSADLGKNPWGDVEAEWKNPELVFHASNREPQEFAEMGMNRDVPVGVFEIDRCPISPDREHRSYILNGGHPKSGTLNGTIES